jgi:hypothetical protein
MAGAATVAPAKPKISAAEAQRTKAPRATHRNFTELTSPQTRERTCESNRSTHRPYGRSSHLEIGPRQQHRSAQAGATKRRFLETALGSVVAGQCHPAVRRTAYVSADDRPCLGIRTARWPLRFVHSSTPLTVPLSISV